MKIINAFIFYCFVTSAFAQEKFATYDNTYSGKTYDIDIHFDKNDEFKLYVNAMSLDRTHESGGFTIGQKQHPDFLKSLNVAKSKYQEWVKTAMDNNVKEVSKEMDIKCKTGSFFLYGREWKFQFVIVPKFEFRVLENEGKAEHLLLVRSGRLTSSSNQYMQVDGFALVFKSADEIDTFVKTISSEAIAAAKSKPKQADLFKN